MKDYKAEYVEKFLNCKVFKAKDILNNTELSQSLVYYLLSNPKKIYKTKAKNVNDLYLYFKSFNLDENKLNNVKRVTRVTYVNE